MPTWKKYKLGGILTLNYGKSLTERNRIPGEIPVFSSSGLTGWHNEPLITRKGIIVGRKGTVGSVFKTSGSFYCIDTAYYIEPNESVYNFEFLYYLLKTLSLDKLNFDSAVPGLNRDMAYNQEIFLPPLPTQHRIAEILGALDDKIELNLQMNKTLEEMAMALYKHWFVDFGPFKDGEFVDSELGPIPKGWEVGRLKDFGKIICGKTPSKKVVANFNGEIQFIKIPDMSGQVWVVNTTDSLSELGHLSQPKKLLSPGSVCVSCIATVGLVALNPYSAHTNQQINSIVPYSPDDKYFLYLACKDLKNTFLQEASGGSATLNMNTSTFSNIKIIKPDEPIQAVFASKVSGIFNMTLNNLEENQYLTQTRDYLLPKLISGEIKVGVAEEKEMI